jgi:hypothetical protein
VDTEVTWQEDNMVFVVPRALADENDLIIALQNNLTIAFGAAAITLNRTREELGVPLPDPIDTEPDQCIALIYQIRNAFAHDIAEPRWKVNNRYKRKYKFGEICIDLSSLHDEVFDYRHIGGPDAFFNLKDYFAEKFLP